MFRLHLRSMFVICYAHLPYTAYCTYLLHIRLSLYVSYCLAAYSFVNPLYITHTYLLLTSSKGHLLKSKERLKSYFLWNVLSWGPDIALVIMVSRAPGC